MKFGTIVRVTPPGIEGKVLGKYLGGLDCAVKVRLLEGTGLWGKDDIVWVEQEAIVPAPLFPPISKCARCHFHDKAPGARLQWYCQRNCEPLTCGE